VATDGDHTPQVIPAQATGWLKNPKKSLPANETTENDDAFAGKSDGSS